jgi:hypothetical protein
VAIRPKEVRLIEDQRRRKLSKIYIAVIDHGDKEGICTVLLPNDERLPLVAIDEKALAVLRNYSQQVANETGKTVSIICFTGSRLYESFTPVATGD